MKNFYSFSLSAILLVVSLLVKPIHFVHAQVPVKLWDKTLGGNSNELMAGIAMTADGSYLLAGSSASQASGDRTVRSRDEDGNIGDFWIVKVNKDGSKVWDRAFGGEGVDIMTCLAPTPDGGFYLGGTSSSEVSGDKSQPSRGEWDYWVVKVDKDGRKVWDKTLGGSDMDDLESLVTTADGGVLLAGYTWSGNGGDKTEPSRGLMDYWVVKLSADGSKMWDKTLGGTGRQMLHAVVETSDGGFLLGGGSDSEASGDKTAPLIGDYDMWIVKLDANGKVLWDKTLGGREHDEVNAILKLEDGGFILAGDSFSGVEVDKTEGSGVLGDFWIVKIDAAGNKIWDRAIPASAAIGQESLVRTSDGGYLLGGSARGEQAWSDPYTLNYWIIKLTENGSKAWEMTLGGSEDDYLKTLFTTPEGDILVGGYSYSGVSGFKSENGRSPNGTDLWVVKLAAGTINSTMLHKDEPLWKVYPNPSSGSFIIEYPGLKENNGGVELALYNALGQQVLRQKVEPNQLQQGIQVQTAAFPAGTYFLHVEQEGRVNTKHVILY